MQGLAAILARLRPNFEGSLHHVCTLEAAQHISLDRSTPHRESSASRFKLSTFNDEIKTKTQAGRLCYQFALGELP
jgi:hypothetical protein